MWTGKQVDRKYVPTNLWAAGSPLDLVAGEKLLLSFQEQLFTHLINVMMERYIYEDF